MPSQFKNYQNLAKKLREAGFCRGGKYSKFSRNGSIANYLLHLYLIKNEPILSRSDLILFKIMKNNDHLTNEFIEALQKEGFIKWDIQENEVTFKGNKKYNYYIYASYKLYDLIEKEKGEQKASKKEFNDLKYEVKSVESKINSLEKAVKYLIEKYDPPFTEEKYNNIINK